MPSRAAKPTYVRPQLPEVRFEALPATLPAHPRAARPLRTAVADRVRCEFVEMRGFSPTVDQAARLFQLTREECGHVLKGLVDEGFLRKTPDGRYRLPSQQ
jgi:hypothetical protein